MNTFDKIHSKRLTQLADHLDSDRRGLDRFDFSIIYRKTACGTAGCAIGEMPALWPDHFVHSSWGWVYRIGATYIGSTEGVMNWFNIKPSEYDHLFLPQRQQTSSFGGKVLSSDATPAEVAANMRAFLEVKAKKAEAKP